LPLPSFLLSYAIACMILYIHAYYLYINIHHLHIIITVLCARVLPRNIHSANSAWSITDWFMSNSIKNDLVWIYVILNATSPVKRYRHSLSGLLASRDEIKRSREESVLRLTLFTFVRITISIYYFKIILCIITTEHWDAMCDIIVTHTSSQWLK